MDRALRLLGEELARRRIKAELVLLGGASLLSRQLIERATSDIDVLGVRLPNGVVRSGYPLIPDVREAADEIGLALGLGELWLDDRPGSDFVNAAPEGFEQRLERANFGPLVVSHLSAHDICVIKICAAAERWGERPNKHWEDVLALGPGPGVHDQRSRLAATRSRPIRRPVPSRSRADPLGRVDGSCCIARAGLDP